MNTEPQVTAVDATGRNCAPDSPEAVWIEYRWPDGRSALAVGPAHPLYDADLE